MIKDINTVALSIRIPKDLYDEINNKKEEQNRSINQQVIFWIRLGKMLDANPDMRTALQLKEQLQ